jgi:hypothetical protein
VIDVVTQPMTGQASRGVTSAFGAEIAETQRSPRRIFAPLAAGDGLRETLHRGFFHAAARRHQTQRRRLTDRMPDLCDLGVSGVSAQKIPAVPSAPANPARVH